MGIPLGIQVLVGKAAVDAAFKQALLERRAEAAAEIGLDLEPAEGAILAAAPREQLEAIIDRTEVPEEHRRAFLGQAAAAMLAAMAAIGEGTAWAGKSIGIGGTGIRPDDPAQKAGKDAENDRPARRSPIEERAIALVAKLFKVDQAEVRAETSFSRDLKAQPADLVRLRAALEKEFAVKFTGGAFKGIRTVGDVVQYVSKPKAGETKQKPPEGPAGLGGVRPDRPPVSRGIRP